MLIECWSHVGKAMINIRPILPSNWKAACNNFIAWGYKQGNSYITIPIDEIDAWKNVVVMIGETLTGQPRTDCIAIINFLNTLNKFNPPEMYSTVEGCIAHEHEMVDGVCRLKDGGVFPPPPPKPEDIKNETDCLAMNWYWYNGVCNVSPQTPAECKNYSECVRKGWFWYDNACHYTAEPLPPTPPQPEDINNQAQCLAWKYFWYDNACHRYAKVEPPPIPIPGGNMFLEYAGHLDEYLKTLGALKVVERGIVVLLRNWFLLIGNFLIWMEKRGT